MAMTQQLTPQYIEVDSTNLVVIRGARSYNTVSYCCDYGISRVQFANVNNPSLDGIDGYVDYSCENQAFVEAGTNYALRRFTLVLPILKIPEHGLTTITTEFFLATKKLWKKLINLIQYQ